MPRKMKVSRAELPELVLDAAERFAEKEGLRGIAMRRIAQEVGVVPGSIYNFVGGVDDIIVRLKARILGRLRERLKAAIDPDADAARNALGLSDAYLDFVWDNARLWSVIIEHSFSEELPMPDWYAVELGQTLGVVDEAIKPLIPEAKEREQAVVTLWAALHGLASLPVSGKLTAFSEEGKRQMARRLVARFLGISGN